MSKELEIFEFDKDDLDEKIGDMLEEKDEIKYDDEDIFDISEDEDD